MTNAASRSRPDHSAFAIALALLLVGAIGVRVLLASESVNLTKEEVYAKGNLQLHTLPESFSAGGTVRWRIAVPDRVMSKEETEELGSQNYISRWYERVPESEDDEPILVELHSVYYTGMIDTVPHVPERCFVGNAGMSIVGGTQVVDVPIDFNPFGPARLVRDVEASTEDRTVWIGRDSASQFRRLPFNVENLRMRVTPFATPGGDTLYAGYFFIANGSTVPSADEVRVKAFNLKSRYAYYAKVQFLSSGVDSPEELAEVAADLLDHAFADLMARMPDWVEIERGNLAPYTSLGAETETESDA